MRRRWARRLHRTSHVAVADPRRLPSAPRCLPRERGDSAFVDHLVGLRQGTEHRPRPGPRRRPAAVGPRQPRSPRAVRTALGRSLELRSGRSGREDRVLASVVVPRGTFNCSIDPTWPPTVSAFRLDLYEVTAGRFRKYLAAIPATMTTPAAPGQGRTRRSPAGVWTLGTTSRAAGWRTTRTRSSPSSTAAIRPSPHLMPRSETTRAKRERARA